MFLFLLIFVKFKKYFYFLFSQVECKRAEPLSKSKIPQDNDGSSSNNNNYFMPNSPPPPPPMLHQLQHPPPSLDLKPAPPAPGIEMWRPPPEGSNSENRKEMTSENGYNSVSNGDSVRQQYTANGAIPSIYQPVSYPGIYSVAQQQQMRQQQQLQSAVPVQQPTTAGQTYPPPGYPNFSSPPPQQSAHDYMAPWNQPASLESPGESSFFFFYFCVLITRTCEDDILEKRSCIFYI